MIPSHPIPLSWTRPESSIEQAAYQAAHMEGYELRTLIVDKSRRQHLATTRHRVWARLRDGGFTYPEIASLFGVHHSTVMYGCRRAGV